MIAEHDRVVLRSNIPEHQLVAGDIGTVVFVHRSGAGYEVEFMALDGETVAVVTLLHAQIRPIARREIAHARLVAQAAWLTPPPAPSTPPMRRATRAWWRWSSRCWRCTSAAARTPHEQGVIAAQIAATDRQIDRLVDELYGLTGMEVPIVEGR